MAEHDVSNPGFWSEAYRAGETHWDLGGPTPIFEWMLQHDEIPRVGPRTAELLVPGCGYGHDVLAAAREGFRVTAVDFAPEPLESLRTRAEAAQLDVRLVHADLFGWLPSQLNRFDVIWEYTCFCAIQPERRAEYLRGLFSALRHGGDLVGLFFPLGAREGGPPFSTTPEEVERLAHAAGFVNKRSFTPHKSVPERAGKERVMVFEKP